MRIAGAAGKSTLEERVAAAIGRLKGDEVLERYRRRVVVGGLPGPRTVLDYLGEQRAVAVGLLGGVYEMRQFVGPTQTLNRVRAGLGLMALQAIPFLWTHEMRQLALAYEMPDHPISARSFPHHAMWWSWETALGTPDAIGQSDGFLIFRQSYLDQHLSGVMRHESDGHESDGWDVYSVGSDDPVKGPLYLKREWALPDGTSSSTLGRHGALLGMSAFLNSHFVAVDAKKPIDTDKRWTGRRVGDPASLNVVTLRSEAREAVQVERGEGPQWKQRWLVRGHFRAQWYPSTKDHFVIWIAPYLKGPEDAPLKLPVYSVVR